MDNKKILNKIREDVNLIIFNLKNGSLNALKLSNQIFNTVEDLTDEQN